MNDSVETTDLNSEIHPTSEQEFSAFSGQILFFFLLFPSENKLGGKCPTDFLGGEKKSKISFKDIVFLAIIFFIYLFPGDFFVIYE